MLNNYTKDNRTTDEVKTDYLTGKIKEQEIFDALKFPKFKINESDKFETMSAYVPDCVVMIAGIWYPAEIKWSDVKLTDVQLKENESKTIRFE